MRKATVAREGSVQSRKKNIGALNKYYMCYIYVSVGVQEIHNRLELFLNCFRLQGPCSFNC